MRWSNKGILQLDKSDIKRINSGKAIALIWDIDDVYVEAGRLGIKNLKEEDAINVLQEIHSRHDCSLGVTWDTISWALEPCYTESRKGKKK